MSGDLSAACSEVGNSIENMTEVNTVGSRHESLYGDVRPRARTSNFDMYEHMNDRGEGIATFSGLSRAENAQHNFPNQFEKSVSQMDDRNPSTNTPAARSFYVNMGDAAPNKAMTDKGSQISIDQIAVSSQEKVAGRNESENSRISVSGVEKDSQKAVKFHDSNRMTSLPRVGSRISTDEANDFIRVHRGGVVETSRSSSLDTRAAGRHSSGNESGIAGNDFRMHQFGQSSEREFDRFNQGGTRYTGAPFQWEQNMSRPAVPPYRHLQPNEYSSYPYNSSSTGNYVYSREMHIPRFSVAEGGRHEYPSQMPFRDSNVHQPVRYTREVPVLGNGSSEGSRFSQSHSKRRQLEPEKYDGKSSVDDYLDHFEQIADWNRWNDEEMAIQLAMSLRGSAKHAYKTLATNERRDYAMLCRFLHKSFGFLNEEMVSQDRFWQRVKGAKESIVDYAGDLTKLAGKAFRGMVTGENRAYNAMMVNKFIAGLVDEDMAKWVHKEHPRNLEDAIAVARDYEAFLKIQNKGGHSKPKRFEAVAMVEMGDVSKGNSEPQTINAVRPSVKTENDSEVLTLLKKVAEEQGTLIIEVKNVKEEVAKYSEELNLIRNQCDENVRSVTQLLGRIGQNLN
jgi:hypothetical protein